MKYSYIITAYRFGERELHSYVVGVYSTKTKALKYADIEEEFRGGKYVCEVLEVKVDYTYPLEEKIKVIKALPVKVPECCVCGTTLNLHYEGRGFTSGKYRCNNINTCGVF